MKTLHTYVIPRPFNGYNIPIAIQSSYLKDYANKNNLIFKLPITEITKSNSYVMLLKLLNDETINNIGFVSGFVLPIYQLKKLNKLLEKTNRNLKFHLALENIVFDNKDLLNWAKNLNDIKIISSDYNKILNED